MVKEPNIHFTRLTEADLPFVVELYNHYTLHSEAVYFTEPIGLDDARGFIPIGDPVYPSFLIRDKRGEAMGLCYFHPFMARPAYRISVEVTVYLRPDAVGRGIGQAALRHLEPYIREGGFTNAVALIDSGNTASIHLVERLGYERCARIRDVAEKWGRKLTLDIYQKQF